MAEKMATRQAYGKFLKELAVTNKNAVVMDADLSGSTMTKEFKAVAPERFFNAGIAEQNLYAMAAGLAHSGKVVFASTFAMFAAGRAFEIIRNSIAYTKANVKVCATHAGLTVGEDGASHQAIEDLALMRSIPGMVVVNPADGASAMALLKAVAEMNGPAYVRLGRAAVEPIYEDDVQVEIGKGIVAKEGKDATIIATGIMVGEAMKAADMLAKEGLDVRVIDMHTIKPLDEEIIIKAAEETGAIVTAEEHTVIGGLGSAVAEVVAQNCPVKMKIVGVQDTFGESGKPGELLAKYGLTAEDLCAAVKALK
ncbi:MAG: transketolase family protein [Firmicutes bacterium]|nr:transketolase family protein [Bacillota bacterium]